MWHSQAAFTLYASNIGFIGLAWFCRELRPVQFLAISLGSAFLLSQLPFNKTQAKKPNTFPILWSKAKAKFYHPQITIGTGILVFNAFM
jgi:hypothetical protein